MQTLAELLRTRTLEPRFQPIVDFDAMRIYAYEALIRAPSGHPLHAADALFAAAEAEGRLLELDAAAARAAVERFQRLALPGRLFVNVHPLTLLEGGAGRLRETLAGVPPERVTIEFTEQHPFGDYAQVRAQAAQLRAIGYRIAIDDLGAGYSGLRLWAELRPDYVKIDRYFIDGIDTDPGKREFVRSIVDTARRLGSRVLAEGIETLEECSTVMALGIGLGQGHRIARPRPVPPRSIPVGALPVRTVASSGPRFGDTAAGLVVVVPEVSPETPVDEAAALLHRSPQLDTLPVTEHGRALGVLRRGPLLDLLLARYGPELHGRKPVRKLMDTTVLQVDEATPLSLLSQRLTDSGRAEHDFVITRAGQCLGIGRMRDVLRRMTELQIRSSCHANPLTLLPGNVPIHERIDEWLAGGQPFIACYADLDGFKPYNDFYGYARGDQVILRLAEVLARHADPVRDFLGHIGGDDFVLLYASEDWHARCEALIEDFAREQPLLYDEAERRAGGIRAADRSGRPCFHPLLSLSVGAVQPDPARCHSHLDVAALLAGAKREAKRRPGNTLFVCRRRGPLPEGPKQDDPQRAA